MAMTQESLSQPSQPQWLQPVQQSQDNPMSDYGSDEEFEQLLLEAAMQAEAAAQEAARLDSVQDQDVMMS
jgi:hypothetical protein